jgi:hypothetical protein
MVYKAFSVYMARRSGGSSGSGGSGEASA